MAESSVSCLFHPCAVGTSGRYVADKGLAPAPNLFPSILFFADPVRLDSLPFRPALASLWLVVFDAEADSVDDIDAGESVGGGAA